MQDVASWALNTASLRGATHADARVVDDRTASLSTKNGKVGSASVSESLGIGIRVIADGAWGFAASDDLSRPAVEAAAARAVEIAKASARVKKENIRLAPEKPAVAEWTTPYKIDPFSTSVEQNIDLLLKIDAELRSVAGVTLAETNMNFPPRGVMVRLLRRRGHSSDQIQHRRGIHRARLCRHRDSEAFLSNFLWRTVAEQRLRTGRGTEASRKRPPHRRRKCGPAQSRSMSARPEHTDS